MINEIGMVRSVLGQMNVGWSWHDEKGGVVEWTFSNSTKSKLSAVLYRSGYYFGNAFWPVYLNNSGFNTGFATSDSPLTDRGTENNSPPIMVVDFKGGQRIVAFVFTISPGQAWSMLEGGFVDGMVPEGPVCYSLSNLSTAPFCIKYDEKQVSEWDGQTGTTLKGYSPNPKTFSSLSGVLPAASPYVQLFDDKIADGKCPQ